MANSRQVDAYQALLTDPRTSAADVAAAARRGEITASQATVLNGAANSSARR